MMTLTALALAASLPAQPVASEPSAWPSVRGTVSYRERIALPPDAELVVRLESLRERGGEPLSLVRMRLNGRQVPIPFQIHHAPLEPAAAAQVILVAEIHVGGRVQFQSERRSLESFAPSRPIQLQLTRSEAVPGAFTQVTWELVELRGLPVQVEGRRPTLLFEADGTTLRGFSSVNNFGGTYSFEAGRLQIDPGAITKMAGPEPNMRAEMEFLQTLPHVNRMEWTASTLRLLRGDTPLATLRRQETTGSR